MTLLRITSLWPPFGVLYAVPSPAHWHELVGPSEQLYVLTGGSTELYDMIGPSEQLYVLKGCDE